MRKSHLIATLTAALLSLVAHGTLPADLLEGDLLFVAPHRANDITAVTQGHDSLAIDHVAILHFIGGTSGLSYALEAIGRGVCLTPIDSFMAHNADATIIVARRPGLDATRSVRNALQYVGRPYDWLYQPGDSAVYCSELVQMCYVNHENQRVFSTTGMTFRDADGRIPQFWTDLYARHGMPVPEGEPGTNPAGLLRHPTLRIITHIPLSRPAESGSCPHYHGAAQRK